MENDLDFLKLEYEKLREEIRLISKELRDTERYTVLVVSAIWVWLATESDHVPEAVFSYSWWLPVFVVILGIARFFGVQQSLNKIAQYIASSIEPKFLTKGDGWENHLESPEMQKKNRWWFSSYLLWGALLVVSVTIALVQKSQLLIIN